MVGGVLGIALSDRYRLYAPRGTTSHHSRRLIFLRFPFTPGFAFRSLWHFRGERSRSAITSFHSGLFPEFGPYGLRRVFGFLGLFPPLEGRVFSGSYIHVLLCASGLRMGSGHFISGVVLPYFVLSLFLHCDPRIKAGKQGNY